MSPMLFFTLPLGLGAVLLLALRRLRPGAEHTPALALLAWFGVVFALATVGVLGNFERMPPKIPLLALCAVATGLLLARRSTPVREALQVMPGWWPVALQAFRAPLELGLYGLFTAGLMPEQMTFAGRNFDVLVGVSAPLMAWLIAKGRAPRWLQWGWQVGALALLVNVVGIAITSAPGPLHRAWPGAPLTIVAQWPFALLPGFLVPMAVLGHLAAIAKLRGAPAPGQVSGGGTPSARARA